MLDKLIFMQVPDIFIYFSSPYPCQENVWERVLQKEHDIHLMQNSLVLYNSMIENIF